jgi:hypothetical protein
MKRLALATLVIASSLRADGLPLSQNNIETLTPIDTLPTTTALDLTFPPDAVSSLVQIASSADADVDLGVQLRAIRSLPLYCTLAAPCVGANPPFAAPYATLVALLKNQPTAPTPHDVLRLRAEIEAFSAISSGADSSNNYTYLVPFLSNASRDIRAATAIALGRLCNPLAIGPLRTRSSAENAPGGSQQVVLAISAALRDLTNTCPGV